MYELAYGISLLVIVWIFKAAWKMDRGSKGKRA